MVAVYIVKNGKVEVEVEVVRFSSERSSTSVERWGNSQPHTYCHATTTEAAALPGLNTINLFFVCASKMSYDFILNLSLNTHKA